MLNITSIKVHLADEGKLKAYVNLEIDGCFMVRGLKVIEASDGLFVAMPNKKTVRGEFRDVAHPIDTATREQITLAVLEVHAEAIKLGVEIHEVRFGGS